MVGGTVGKVVHANNSAFQVGDIVAGYWGWQEFAVSGGHKLRNLDPTLAPVSTALGVLGMPGMTTCFGLLDICSPQPGETVVVSGAAGAVGSFVGQIAKIVGSRAVGIAGSDQKVAWLVNELGFAGGFNYKTSTSVCGQISQYNALKPEPGLRMLKQASAEGFLVFQFADRYGKASPKWRNGCGKVSLKYREQTVEGLENTPGAFIALLQGENTGKMSFESPTREDSPRAPRSNR